MQEKLSREVQKRLDDVRANYFEILENISRAAEGAGRQAGDITFLAATKTVEPSVINYAVSLGLRYIGENKVQELLSKYDEYDLENCDLQFIGHLQSNKVRQIIDKVSLIQSVDSFKLAQEINRLAGVHNKTMDILCQRSESRTSRCARKTIDRRHQPAEFLHNRI